MNVVFKGACLSGKYGKVTVSPSNQLSLFFHKDSQAVVNMPLNSNTITVHNHLVSLGTSPKIRIIEHFFSALYGLNLFSVKIDFWSDELPFFDGSSEPFVTLLSKIKNTNSIDHFMPERAITLRTGDSFLYYEPVQDNNLTIDMQLSHPYITTQRIVITVNKKNYMREIAPARTFVYTTENDPRLKNLPSYGIGVTKNGFHAATPLRFHDELVRHKILDLLGDLYVIKKKLIGKIIAQNTSHYLNLKFTKKLIQYLKDT
jgi:UDP-3-O-[3-hydroxymyristoyl] N-acetylglucosamine deacetylase